MLGTLLPAWRFSSKQNRSKVLLTVVGTTGKQVKCVRCQRVMHAVDRDEAGKGVGQSATGVWMLFLKRMVKRARG